MSRPLCAFLLHDGLHFEEVRKGDGAGGGGDEEGRVGAEAEERAKFAVEGVGDFFPGRFVVEEATVGRVLDVWPEGRCAEELPDFPGVALVEGGEFAMCVGPCIEGTVGDFCVHGVAVLVMTVEETDVLETAELEFEIATPALEFGAALAGPLYGWL